MVECTGHDGAIVMLDGSDSSPSESDGGTYDWSIDGIQIAAGEQPAVLLGLGDHAVTLTVSNDEGQSDADIVEITVQDTTSPIVSAEMSPSGENGHKYDIVATATDTCDPAPIVEAKVGADVGNGASITTGSSAY